MRRAGRIATGIDRVELAYLAQFLEMETPVFGLVRSAFGYLLLDRSGMIAFQDRLTGRVQWGRADLASRMLRGRGAAVQRAESDVRRLAVDRAVPFRLASMLAAHLPAGFAYINVGHSNLTDRVLGAVTAAQGQIAVMVHDVIPIEYPQYQRPGTIAPFSDKMRRVARRADLVIYNSDDTRNRAEAVFREWGRVPPPIVAHLGTMMPAADAALLPQGLPPERPYFVTVGTIEPRKNHSFLLDIWDDLGPDAPPLLICGSRGWNNDAVFARLDALPPDSPIKEVSGLADPALAALIATSSGLLFPSHAEGFGLPPIEALMLGTRVLCNDLPVLHEIVGNKADYASVSDSHLWLNTIKNWQKNGYNPQSSVRFRQTTWTDHFKVVLRLT